MGILLEKFVINIPEEAEEKLHGLIMNDEFTEYLNQLIINDLIKNNDMTVEQPLTVMSNINMQRMISIMRDTLKEVLTDPQFKLLTAAENAIPASNKDIIEVAPAREFVPNPNKEKLKGKEGANKLLEKMRKLKGG